MHARCTSSDGSFPLPHCPGKQTQYVPWYVSNYTWCVLACRVALSAGVPSWARLVLQTAEHIHSTRGDQAVTTNSLKPSTGSVSRLPGPLHGNPLHGNPRDAQKESLPSTLETVTETTRSFFCPMLLPKPQLHLLKELLPLSVLADIAQAHFMLQLLRLLLLLLLLASGSCCLDARHS